MATRITPNFWKFDSFVTKHLENFPVQSDNHASVAALHIVLIYGVEVTTEALWIHFKRHLWASVSVCGLLHIIYRLSLSGQNLTTYLLDDYIDPCTSPP